VVVKIQRDAFLVAAIQYPAVGKRRNGHSGNQPNITVRIAIRRPFNLDYFGAEVRHDHGRRGGGDVGSAIHYA
jgi:hypothetical protein